MEAIKYFEGKKRMLESLGRIGEDCREVECKDCLLAFENNGREITCRTFELEYPQEAIEIIEKWMKAHPRKTYLQDFSEKHPKATMRNDGAPTVCPYMLGYTENRQCVPNYDCFECWNREME